jgi:hypothetical protein
MESCDMVLLVAFSSPFVNFRTNERKKEKTEDGPSTIPPFHRTNSSAAMKTFRKGERAFQTVRGEERKERRRERGRKKTSAAHP